MSMRVMDLISSIPDDVPPRYGSDRSPVAIARVIRLVEGGRALIVSLYGGAPMQIPATAVNWNGVDTAHVLIDPDTGRPVHALGPAPTPERKLPEWAATSTTPAPTREAILTPEWVGTWDGSTWSRYGGDGAWQGTPQGLSRLRSLILYGRQAEALGPITITSATLTARLHPSAYPWTARLVPALYSDSGPAFTTAIAGINTPINQETTTLTIDITRLAPSLTTPGVGLALIGTQYGGIQMGADSLTLHVTYTPKEQA